MKAYAALRHAILLATTLALTLPGIGHAAARIGHVEASGQPLDQVLKLSAEQIAERTDGRVEFSVFPSSQLGNARAMTEAVQLGMQDAVVVPAAFIGGFNPLVSILDIPYLIPTSDDQANALRKSEFGRALLDSFKEKGFEAVALWPGGFKHFTSNKKLEGIGDFKGQKFRIMDSRVLRAQFEAVGAQAMPIPFGDVYTSLQTGVVDGQENPLDSIARMKFHEVQKYLLLSAHGVVENVVLFSPTFWAGLSDADKKTVRQVFVDNALELAKVKGENQKQALEEIKAAGLTINELDDAEQQALREKMYPAARDAFLDQAGDKGQTLIDLYESVYSDITE
ncbi:MAG: TRAP transporter substrate-binding protein [Alcanivorax sp.]|uniref:TRAP transporter substrate-binding protein n=1 Tax=Alloalcanivorax marinus TaxID=1177169 RepID=UPI00195A2598|nr:TRAP transporter substrate-binding protein [Alloalcanivorax marinus]MBM7332836.1 TRAP transporter substrate-binding protein [Alloalcanivorax marinus]